MTRNQTLHRLLQFIVEHGASSYGSEELRMAFKGSLSIEEIEDLCQELINDGVLLDSTTKDGFSITQKNETRRAFVTRKYLRDDPDIEGSQSAPIQREDDNPKKREKQWWGKFIHWLTHFNTIGDAVMKIVVLVGLMFGLYQKFVKSESKSPASEETKKLKQGLPPEQDSTIHAIDTTLHGVDSV